MVHFPEIAKGLLSFPKFPHWFWGPKHNTMRWVMWVISPGVRRSVREPGQFHSEPKFIMSGVMPPLHRRPSRANRDNLNTSEIILLTSCFNYMPGIRTWIIYVFCLWCYSPTRSWDASFLRFLSHTQLNAHHE